jgi:hypothetical protein
MINKHELIVLRDFEALGQVRHGGYGEPRQIKYLAQSAFYSFTRSGTLLARKRELVADCMSTQAASNRIFRHSPN